MHCYLQLNKLYGVPASFKSLHVFFLSESSCLFNDGCAGGVFVCVCVCVCVCVRVCVSIASASMIL